MSYRTFQPTTLWAVGVVCAAAAALAFAAVAVASGTYAPPLPARANKGLLTGEKLWKAERIVGPGGRTCAACHERRRGTPLDGDSLAGKRQDLDKLIYFCVITRSRNSLAQPDGPEIRALQAYLTDRYELDRPRVQPPDDGRAESAIARARHLYLQGGYDEAIDGLNGVLQLTVSPRLEAEAHLLLGSIYHVLGEVDSARRHFARVFRLFPTARIDGEIFSPSTVKLFESVRAEASAASNSGSGRTL